MARSLELGNNFLVNLGALGLAVWLVRTADVDALVPVKTQPAQSLNNLLVALLRVS